MNGKDWILLVVPIIVNGILVYLFQYVVSMNIEKKARLQRNRYKILEEFHLQLANLYNACKLFADSLSARYGDNVENTFNQEILSYKEFNLFCLTHKKMLSKYATAIEQICKETESVHREMIHIQTDHNGIISSETIVPTAEHHNKMTEILEQTIDKCCRELDKIYA